MIAATTTAVDKKYIHSRILATLEQKHAVDLAKSFVDTKRNTDLKSGLKNLAKHGALHLSFEQTMLRDEYSSLFSEDELTAARFYLREAQLAL